MSFIHDLSCECVKSELDLFSVPPTQTSIIGGQWIEYRPLSSLDDGVPIEFCVSGSGDDYIDFSKSWLRVVAKVKNKDSGDLVAGAKVAPVNNWLHSLFSQVDLSLNGTLITTSGNTYPYRSYIENHLTFGSDAKESQLTSELFYADEVNNFDNVPSDENVGKNSGQDMRRKLIAEGLEVEMIGRLHLDIFYQPKLMLNGVDLKLNLNRSKNSFNLQYSPDDGEFTTEITQASLFIRKVKISPAIQMAHIKALGHAKAKYPVRRIETKTFSVPAGNLEANQPNLFLGQRPKRLVIGIVDNDAFNGAAQKNPFNFKNYDLCFLSVYVEGTQVPSKPFTPNFRTRKGCMRSFFSLFHATGKLGSDSGNGLSRTDYLGDGNLLYVIDLSHDQSDGNHLELRENGCVGLEIKFARALPQTVNVLVYSEFENLIQIDRNRRVTVDYGN